MSEIRTRTRTSGPSAGRSSLKKTGADARALHQRETERQEELRNKVFAPFRFFVPKPRKDKGETEVQGKYVILDSDIDQCPAFYEHALPNPDSLDKQGNRIRNKFEFCLKETEDCPACRADDGSPKYVQAISIINLRGYTNKKGEKIPYTKQLLMVTHQQQGWFRRLCNEKLGGNMRGAMVHAYRDGADMSYRIGVPDFQKQYSEAALKKSFNNDEIRTKDGKLIKAAGSDMFPFDYDEVLPEKTGDQLRAELGGVTPAGSKAEVDAEWNEPDDGESKQDSQEAAAAMKTDDDELADIVGDDDGQDTTNSRQAPKQAQPSSDGFVDLDDEIPF